MKRRTGYVIAGSVFYLLFLLIQLPAAWFAWGLDRYTHGTVRLDPSGGTLWHGQGHLVAYPAPAAPFDFGQTQWRINPLWLVTGRVRVTLRAEQPQQRIKTTVDLGGRRLALKDTRVEIPAASAARWYAPAALLAPEGSLDLSADELTVEPERITGAAALEWRNAASRLSPVRPLGRYRLEVTGAGATAALKLNTLEGALTLSGQGQWAFPSGDIRFTGEARAREKSADLEGLLRNFGEDRGDGRRTFSFNLRLPPSLFIPR